MIEATEERKKQLKDDMQRLLKEWLKALLWQSTAGRLKILEIRGRRNEKAKI